MESFARHRHNNSGRPNSEAVAFAPDDVWLLIFLCRPFYT